MRKQLVVRIGLQNTARVTRPLKNMIRDAIEKCDHRIGGVEVREVEVDEKDLRNWHSGSDSGGSNSSSIW